MTTRKGITKNTSTPMMLGDRYSNETKRVRCSRLERRTRFPLLLPGFLNFSIALIKPFISAMMVGTDSPCVFFQSATIIPSGCYKYVTYSATTR